MVFNRLCAPDSKPGCLRWLDTVAMPAMPQGANHQNLLRAMDALMDHSEAVEVALAPEIRPLVDHDPTIVFHDLTTLRIHGEGEVDDDLRAFGMNKETGGSRRRPALSAGSGAHLPPSRAIAAQCPVPLPGSTCAACVRGGSEYGSAPS